MFHFFALFFLSFFTLQANEISCQQIEAAGGFYPHNHKLESNKRFITLNANYLRINGGYALLYPTTREECESYVKNTQNDLFCYFNGTVYNLYNTNGQKIGGRAHNRIGAFIRSEVNGEIDRDASFQRCLEHRDTYINGNVCTLERVFEIRYIPFIASSGKEARQYNGAGYGYEELEECAAALGQ